MGGINEKNEMTKFLKTKVFCLFTSGFIPFICGLIVFLGFSVAVFAGPTPVPTPDNHPLFEKAQQYFKEKKYKEAKQILNQLVAKASPLEDYVPKARLLLANLQDDFSISIAQFKSLAAEYNNSPEGEEAQ